MRDNYRPRLSSDCKIMLSELQLEDAKQSQAGRLSIRQTMHISLLISGCLDDVGSFGADTGRHSSFILPDESTGALADRGNILHGFKFWWWADGHEFKRLNGAQEFAGDVRPPGYLGDRLEREHSSWETFDMLSLCTSCSWRCSLLLLALKHGILLQGDGMYLSALNAVWGNCCVCLRSAVPLIHELSEHNYQCSLSLLHFHVNYKPILLLEQTATMFSRNGLARTRNWCLLGINALKCQLPRTCAEFCATSRSAREFLNANLSCGSVICEEVQNSMDEQGKPSWYTQQENPEDLETYCSGLIHALVGHTSQFAVL